MTVRTATSLADRMILPAHSVGLVDIVSGSFGAGHDAAAREIRVRLEREGYVTRTWDIVDLMPGPLGRGLRAGYLRQIQSAPATWRWLLRCIENQDGVARFIARSLESTAGPLIDIASARPAAIISTHPFASQALGQLRADGRLDVPVVTYLTDMSVHRLWVHPSVDLHLAIHARPAEEARALGAGSTRVICPAVPEAFCALRESAPSQADCRRSLGLPLDERLVLVTGGACGIGELEQSAADIASTGVAVPVVLCGRNQRLLRRVRSNRSAIALGWTDNVPLVLGAMDGVVQNSGGFTSLETLAAGVPIVTYRCIAGHGETNARALDEARLVPWIRETVDLASGLSSALSASTGGRLSSVGLGRPDVVEAVFAASLLRSA